MDVFYHNPRCSKSRQALQILKTKNHKFEVREYLKVGLKVDEVKHLLSHYSGDVKSLIRTKEQAMSRVEIFWNNSDSIAEALVKEPILLERPILVSGNKVRLGRPPEDILD